MKVITMEECCWGAELQRPSKAGGLMGYAASKAVGCSYRSPYVFERSLRTSMFLAKTTPGMASKMQ